MKTKIFTVLLAAVTSVGTMFAAVVNGTCGDNLTWTLDTKTKTLSIEGSGKMTDYELNNIHAPWYEYKQYVVNVSMPEGLTNIGDYAFTHCSNLAFIKIPNSVTSIGGSAFYYCYALTTIEIPNSVTSIGGSAFYYCSALTTIEIPNSVTSIGKSAFSGCSSLTSVTIPNSVTSIGDEVFAWCTGLTSVTIPNSVTSIGEYAFHNCTALTTIEIPNSVTSIGKYAFQYCSSLPVYNNIRYADTYLVAVVDKTLSSYSIKDGTKWIGDAAFYKCSSLSSVTIPSSVVSIGDYAFYDCSKLTSIEIPNSVTSIGSNAFENCTAITSITIPNGITSIGDYAFSGCKSLPSVTIPNSVTSIRKSAFSGCGSLTSIDIPESVNIIEKNAFLGVQNVNYNGAATGAPWGALALNGKSTILSASEISDLASLLSDNETSKDYYRFAGVISYIKEVNTTYGNATFNITDGTSTFMCYRIHDYYSTSFISSNQLSVGDSVVISSKVQNYQGNTPEATQGRLVYHSANPLITPDSIFYYGHRKDYPDELKLYTAFVLDTLDIPCSVSYEGQNYTVTEMASGAFYNKENLKCIKLPSTLKLMPHAFERCWNIQSLYYNAKNLEKPITIPFAESNSTLHTIYIGENVGSLPNEFFNNLTNITSVYWNAINCNDMQYSPFYYSRNNIVDFIIANNIEHIPANMCWGMSNLTEFNIPSSVTTIGKDAFHWCTGLTTLSLGENLTTYGDSIFAGCSALTSIYNYRERPAKLGLGTFDGIDIFYCTLYVLAGSVDMYKSTGSDWKDFYFVEAIGATNTTTDEIKITPAETTADIVWPVVEGAATYELVIKDKNGHVICTLIFNAAGQLTEIAFAAPSRDGSSQNKQAAGFSFTVTGLNAGTSYDLTMTAKNDNGDTIDQKEISFTTQGKVPTAIDEVSGNEQFLQTTKILRNGQVLIQRGDKLYTLTGQEVK